MRYPTQNIPICWYILRWVTQNSGVGCIAHANPRRQVFCVLVEYRLKREGNLISKVCIIYKVTPTWRGSISLFYLPQITPCKLYENILHIHPALNNDTWYIPLYINCICPKNDPKKRGNLRVRIALRMCVCSACENR